MQRTLEAAVPGLTVGAISAMIATGRRATEFSERIAEALGVEHRWLQLGEGPKLRQAPWPFRSVSQDECAELSERRLGQIEGLMSALLMEERKEHRQAVFKRAA